MTEFIQKIRFLLSGNVSDGDFIYLLFRWFLGRTVDPSGAAGYRNDLARGFSREEVLSIVLYSEEAKSAASFPDIKGISLRAFLGMYYYLGRFRRVLERKDSSVFPFVIALSHSLVQLITRYIFFRLYALLYSEYPDNEENVRDGKRTYPVERSFLHYLLLSRSLESESVLLLVESPEWPHSGHVETQATEQKWQHLLDEIGLKLICRPFNSRQEINSQIEENYGSGLIVLESLSELSPSESWISSKMIHCETTEQGSIYLFEVAG